MPTRILMGD